MRWLWTLVTAIGLVASLSTTPAFADHDDDRHWHRDRRHHHHGDWDHPRRYYGSGYYDRGYYYEPRVEYYAAPRVYVPPPPSFGLNLVFPIH